MRKRAWWFLWLMPLFVAAGPLYIYWLDHPPVTNSETELRVLVDWCDEIAIYRMGFDYDHEKVVARLRGSEIKDFFKVLRLSSSQHFRPASEGLYLFKFSREGRTIASVNYYSNSKECGAMVTGDDAIWGMTGYLFQPRFIPRFEEFIQRKLRSP